MIKSLKELEKTSPFIGRYRWELADNNRKIHFKKFKREHPSTLKLSSEFRFGLYN